MIELIETDLVEGRDYEVATPCPTWCVVHWQQQSLSFHTSQRVKLGDGMSLILERCDDPRGNDGSAGTRVLIQRRDSGCESDEIPAEMLPVIIPALEALQAHLTPA